MKFVLALVMLFTVQAHAGSIDNALANSLLRAGVKADALDHGRWALGPGTVQCTTGTPLVCSLTNELGDKVIELRNVKAQSFIYSVMSYIRAGGDYSNEGTPLVRSEVQIGDVISVYCAYSPSLVNTRCHVQLDSQN